MAASRTLMSASATALARAETMRSDGGFSAAKARIAARRVAASELVSRSAMNWPIRSPQPTAASNNTHTGSAQGILVDIGDNFSTGAAHERHIMGCFDGVGQ